jgi:hypothetical protein
MVFCPKTLIFSCIIIIIIIIIMVKVDRIVVNGGGDDRDCWYSKYQSVMAKYPLHY